jgi:GNAT superfamily N-acetyltransferase
MYFKEREGFETLEDENAILSYRISGEECYIRDIFVLPEHRLSGAGSRLADMMTNIAKAAGCNHLTGSVVPSTKGSSASLMALLKYGFKVHESANDFIVLIKEI